MNVLNKKRFVVFASVLLIATIIFILYKSNSFESDVCKAARTFYTNTENGEFKEVLKLVSNSSRNLTDENSLIQALEVGREDMKSRGGISSINVKEIYNAGNSSLVIAKIYYKGDKKNPADALLVLKIDTLKLIREEDRWVIYLQPIY